MERLNNYIIKRPESSAVGNLKENYKVDAEFNEYWKYYKEFPSGFVLPYGDMNFAIKLTKYKHICVFPEQADNWDYLRDKISNASRDIKVLNLFAYTGCASIAASLGGAVEVTQVDASKAANEIAKENALLSNASGNIIRYITDDVLKFVQREIRRNKKYDVIIMDPPAFGRGPNNEMWKFSENLDYLLEETKKILSDNPLLVIVNCYTKDFKCSDLYTSLKSVYKGANILCDELCLPVKYSNNYLKCGITGRITF